MESRDLPQVVAIEEQVTPVGWSEGIFEDTLNNSDYYCWVLEDGARIAGFGILGMAADEATLLNIALHPNYQRRGLGQSLLTFLIEQAKELGAQTLFLEVRVSNMVAISLYFRFGFRQIALRRDYYPLPVGREDALIMSLLLTEGV